MSLLFDASSIFAAIQHRRITPLEGQYTVEIARYELGNFIWKHRSIHGTLDDRQYDVLSRNTFNTLNTMTTLHIGGREIRVLELAEELQLAFYDASYVYLTRETGSILVTEDTRLMGKAESVEIPVKRFEEIL